MTEYHPHILPDGWEWIGAIAAPDGYNGLAHVANVARCTEGFLWEFTKPGRYRIHEDRFNRRRISDSPLAGAPFQFHPVNYNDQNED